MLELIVYIMFSKTSLYFDRRLCMGFSKQQAASYAKVQKSTIYEKNPSKYLQIKQICISLHPLSRTIETTENGVVVQLVRIHACHAWGRGFESRPHRKEKR